MMKQLVALLLCLGVLVGPASAQASETLGLSQVLESALSSHPTAQIASAVEGEARGSLLEAKGNFDLKAYAEGQTYPAGYYDRTSAEVGISQPTTLWGAELKASYKNGFGFAPYDGKAVTSELGQAALSLFVPLLRDGAIDERRMEKIRAELELTIAQQRSRALRAELLGSAARAYFKWVGTGAKAQVYAALLELAETRQTFLEHQVSLGHIASIELVDNQRTLAQRRAQVARAELERTQEALALSLYLRSSGRPHVPDATWAPPGLEFPLHAPASVPQTVLADMATAPEPLIYRRGLDLLDRELHLARNQGLPRVDLRLALTQSGGPERPYSDADSSVSETTFGGSLSISLDVQRRKARGKVAALSAKKQGLESKLQLVGEMLSVRLQSYHATLHAGHQIAQQSREATEAALQMAQAERERLALGQSSILNVNLREQAVQSARLSEIEATLDYHLAWIEIHTVLGRDSPGAYVRPPTPAAQTGAPTPAGIGRP